MCIDSSHEAGKWTCCGCLSLSTGMMILGALQLLGVIVNLCYGYWTGAIWDFIFLVPFILAVLKLKNASRRKFLMISYIVKCILEILAVMIACFWLDDFVEATGVCVEG